MSVLLVALAVAVFSAPAKDDTDRMKEDTDQFFGFLSPTNNGTIIMIIFVYTETIKFEYLCCVFL